MKHFVRTPYNYDRNKASDQSGLACKDATRTQQHFAEEVDINTIVRRFNLTGQLPTNIRMPEYGDFENAFDFHTAMNAIRQAQESFMAMPANIRARFHNDPGEFVDFVADDANRAEAEKFGLVSQEALQRAAELAKAPPPNPAPKTPETPPKGA